MSNQQYTPGPWKLGTIEDGIINIDHIDRLGSNTHISLAKVVWQMECEDRSLKCEANARLIAAAPELLAALEEMVNAYVIHTPDHCNPDWFDDYNRAKSIISKAKGGA